MERSHDAYAASTIDVSGRNAASSQATFAELVPSERGVFSRLYGKHEWKGEIDDEKSLWILVVQCGGSGTPAYTWEATDPGSRPQILVKRPIIKRI